MRLGMEQRPCRHDVDKLKPNVPRPPGSRAKETTQALPPEALP